MPPETPEMIRLHLNESPYPVPAALIEKALRAATGVHRYPEAPPVTLRTDYAEYANRSAGLAGDQRIEPARVIPANGGDEAINLAVQGLRSSIRQVVVMPPTFSEYARAAEVAGLPVVQVPLTQDWRVDLDQLIQVTSACPSLVFICDPNNPTGNRVGAAAIVEALTRANPETYVAVDEAYWEFNLGAAGEAAMTVAGLISRYPNLIVLRTMSKAFALAGARLGFALAGRETAARLEAVRMAFNVNVLSMAVAEVVLNEDDYVRDVVARVIDGRRRLTAGLAGIAGLSPLPSWTNFVLVGTVRPAAEVAKALADRGVRVRLFPDARLSNHFRISVGRPEELDQCLEALSDVMEGDS